MVVTASITGIFKTILLILGGFVVLRFLGQFMIAKRNMEDERKLNNTKREFEQERNSKLKNFGKTSILNKTPKPHKAPNLEGAEDVDFEEMK